MRYSKAIVLLVIALNVCYTAAVLWVNLHGHDVSDALTHSWFAFTVGELLTLGGITISRNKWTSRAESRFDESAETDNEDEAEG